MAQSAGTVSVSFEAQTAQFTAELKKVQTQLGALERSVKGAQQQFSQFTQRALQAFSGAALLSFAKSAFMAADATADAAERAGIAVDSFSRLQFAAEQTDVEMSALTSGIRLMQVELSKAAGGSEAAQASLAKFGIKAEDIINLPIEQQFAAFAEGFQKIGGTANQTAALVEVFGRTAGPQLRALLKEGGDAILEYMARADALGITMSESTARAIGLTDRKIKELMATVRGIGREAIAGVATMIFPPKEEIDKKVLELDQLQKDLAAQSKRWGPGKKWLPVFVTEEDIAITKARIKVLTDEIAAFDRAQAEAEKAAAALVIDPVDEVALQTRFKKYDEHQQELTEIRRKAAEDRLKLAQEESQGEIDRFQFVNDEMARLRTEQTAAFTPEVQSDVDEINRREKEKQDTIEAYRRQDERNTLTSEETKQAFLKSTYDATIGLLLGLAPISKKAAIAAVAIEKGKALVEAFMAGKVAIMKAWASAPWPYNAPAVAMATTVAALNLAAIASSAYGQVKQIQGGAGGAGGAPLGTVTNPAVVTPQADATRFGATSQNAINIVIANNFGIDQRVLNQVIDAVKEAANERDVIIFNRGSAQAQELIGG